MRPLVLVFLLASALLLHTANAFTYDIMASMLGLPMKNARGGNVGGGGSLHTSPNKKQLTGGGGGGGGCAGCTLIVAILSQTMQYKQQSAKEAFATVCGYLPSPLNLVCDLAAPSVSTTLFPLLDKGESPDTICNVMGSCKVENGAVCRLFPEKKQQQRGSGAASALTDAEFVSHVNGLRLQHPIPADGFQAFNVCTILPGVCKFADHMAFEDNDGDKFSTIAPLRGSNWLGKDCNDKDATVYPGRNPFANNGAADGDRTADSNCNGIWGVNNATGLNYEEEFCGRSRAFGVATLGDSANAHFRLPEDFIDVTKMSKEVFANVISLIANELDFPMTSWATGHEPTSKYSPIISGSMTSVYSLMNKLDKCTHRDFQNIGVNGADSKNLLKWVDLVARDRVSDKSLLAFFAMVGNDVCGHTQDFDHMTKPDVYYASVLAAVRAADAKFPKGSHIVLVPLVDGRILYDSMHDSLHPIGLLNKDVTYTDFYNYLNCLETSPCWGWMNSNATVRDGTFAVSESLNAQLPRVVADTKGTLRNVNVHFIGNIFDDVLSTYTGPKSDLIEPVDGFHPSQTANALLGNFTFLKLQAMGVIPKDANPNNDMITKVFGDQGGY